MEKKLVKINLVKKRDSGVVSFNASKINSAILKAMKILDMEDEKKSEELTQKVVAELNKNFKNFNIKGIPSIEEIQDSVEKVLEQHDERLFKIYSLYRRSRHHAREIREFFKINDDLKFTANALKVLEERYLLKDEDGKIIETPTEMFWRVANAIARADKNYNKNDEEIKLTALRFFNMMKNLEFLPNSPALFNAGTEINQLAACFVLDIEDSLKSIFTTLKNSAIILQTGGGVGFNFSKLRPHGDIVKSTHGTASGPVSFMKIFDVTTDVIKAGGKRRGACMAILNCSHPDIELFIHSKENKKELSNFNISAAVTDEFMNCVKSNREFSLINPRNQKIVKKVKAGKLFEDICNAAWISGDPGLIFIDRINKDNPTAFLGKIESTNPCSEQPLLPFESCVLGSINLNKIAENNKIDWDKLKDIIYLGVHFLDNCIDANRYPIEEIERITRANRKIGLGIMGFADLLTKLKIPYNSEKALNLAEKLMSFINKEARNASVKLAEERYSFPNFSKSIWNKTTCLRNASITTIAPTGSISIIAGCSSGIEPLFAIAYIREIMEGKKLVEINKNFQLDVIKRNLYKDKIIREIIKTGSIQNTNLPEDIKKSYVCAFDILPEWHVKMQAAFQKHVDSAVSKTVNLPENSTTDDIKKVYMLAWKLGCKGITVYRYGSKPQQVLYIGKKTAEASPHYSGGSACSVCSF